MFIPPVSPPCPSLSWRAPLLQRPANSSNMMSGFGLLPSPGVSQPAGAVIATTREGQAKNCRTGSARLLSNDMSRRVRGFTRFAVPSLAVLVTAGTLARPSPARAQTAELTASQLYAVLAQAQASGTASTDEPSSPPP